MLYDGIPQTTDAPVYAAESQVKKDAGSDVNPKTGIPAHGIMLDMNEGKVRGDSIDDEFEQY